MHCLVALLHGFSAGRSAACLFRCCLVLLLFGFTDVLLLLLGLCLFLFFSAGCCEVVVWLAFGCCLASDRLLFGCCVLSVWPLFGCELAAVWLLFRRLASVAALG